MQLKDFLLAGVYQNKLIEYNRPMFAWSLTNKRIVLPEDIKIIKKNGVLVSEDYENNIHINLSSYSKLTKEMVDEINNSEDGAIMMNDERYFRYKVIPTKEYVSKNYIKIN